ncbi:Protein ALTERED PHOSPHATE STARVATION RESPONSE 1, partial [Cucurbita argyrosperma subsp. sororia]
MGCSSSKVDDLPAVALCRERCAFLDEAIHLRYSLAEAHMAYIHSLKGIGHSLHNFIEESVDPVGNDGSVIDDSVSPPHHLCHSESDDESDSLHDFDHSPPFVPPHDGHMGYMMPEQERFGSYPGGGSGGGGGFMHMNYMRKSMTPSVVYEQRPMSPEKVYHAGESSSFSGHYPYPYYGYPQDGGYGSMSSAGGSGSSPPPPPPPRPSAWAFLNPFEAYEKYYSANTPSQDLKEVREEEEIPELEDECNQHEVVKELHGSPKFTDDGGGTDSKIAAGDEHGGDDTNAMLSQSRPNAAAEDDAVKHELHQSRPGSQEVYEVAREIEAQFERASESGNETAKMLEAGKLPYQQTHVSSKNSHVHVAPSVSKSVDPSTSSAEFRYIEEFGMASGNLSSTLRKLHLWEKKLYNEVKAEEKMRVVHERKYRKLKRLDEKGAEAHEVDTTQTSVRSLSTKIRVAIQVVDKISMTINKIRDEELWPQLNELIHGLTRMWRSMLECHRAQYKAISESKSFGRIGSGKCNDSEAHLEATKELEHELLNWTISFSSWISAQKGYVRVLNNWLLKCLLYEPEDTPDGLAPFSPGRIGAPLVFVICNQWSQALDSVTEKEVIDSMRVFSTRMLQIWEHDKLITRQRMMAKVRNFDRDDQKIQKQIQALDKKTLMVSRDEKRLSASGNAVYQNEMSHVSLQSSVQRVFEAMERFTADSMKVYEELLRRTEEERLNRAGKSPISV